MAFAAAKPRAAILLARIVTLAMVMVAVCVALLAWWPEVHLHRSAGHVLVITTWLAAPVFIGVAGMLGLTSRRWSSLLDVTVALCAVASCLLLSFSGFLPSETVDAPAQLRFVILHRFVFPLFTMLTLGYIAIRSFAYGEPSHHLQ